MQDIKSIINFIKKFVIKGQSSYSTKEEKLNKFLFNFFANPQHQWIVKQTYISRILSLFFKSLDEKTLDFFSRGKDLIILQTNGKLSCTLTSMKKAHFIIIFPELFKLLNSCSPNHGLAILAHELGHIIQEHSIKKIDLLESQIEADRFAFKLGLGKELTHILKDYEYLPECKIRLEKLNELLILNTKIGETRKWTHSLKN